jgi:(2Fe-2S) ferredoxin
MKAFIKNVTVEIDLKLFKESLAYTQFDENNLSELVEKLLEGDFPVRETIYGESRSPFLVNLVSVKNIDSKWSED